jgi:hypothetical protein
VKTEPTYRKTSAYRGHLSAAVCRVKFRLSEVTRLTESVPNWHMCPNGHISVEKFFPKWQTTEFGTQRAHIYFECINFFLAVGFHSKRYPKGPFFWQLAFIRKGTQRVPFFGSWLLNLFWQLAFLFLFFRLSFIPCNHLPAIIFSCIQRYFHIPEQCFFNTISQWISPIPKE